MPEAHEVEYETYEESWTGRIVAAAVIALALIAGAFFAGKAMAGGGGPSTLADAVQQAQDGKLPCGETNAVTLRGGAGAPAAAAGGDGAPPGGEGGPGFGAGGPQGGGFLRAICDGGQDQQGQGARTRFGGQTGEVTKVDGSTLTINGPMGETTVKLGSDTTVTKSASGAVSDIKPGDSVLVAGARDGAAARSVTILPGSN
ncbi:MAG TPA: hypothetical protein VNS09_26965 [Solirubrobacter sp.]|nr:hypothetical protein [Solirubrobacter sp.]